MKKYTFNGDWKFDLNLPLMAKMNSDLWFGNGEHNAKLESARVPVEISDHRNLDPDPKVGQLATIEYIFNHEEKIMKSLVTNINVRINKLHYEACGDEELLKKIHGVNDIGTMIGLSEIIILQEEKDDLAYYALMCEYIGDYEHGLSLTFYKDELIGFEGSGEVDYNGIAEHSGGFPQYVIDDNIAAQDFGRDMIHIPHVKYGKLKPWQDEENCDYCYKLMQLDDSKKLIDEINSGKIDIHTRFKYSGDNLLDMACRKKNHDLIDYFIANKVSSDKSVSKCIGRAFDEQILRKLVAGGAEINPFDFRNESPFVVEVKEYASALFQLERNRNKSQTDFDKAMNRATQSEYRLPIFVELGVDPSRCTIDGKDYKSALMKHWNINYIEENRLFEKIDALLFPPKNPAWSFFSV